MRGTPPPPGRIGVFIDGFNVYHSIKAAIKHEERPRQHFWKYLWLDYRALAHHVLPKDLQIAGVHYFTAYPAHDPDSQARHQVYVRALEAVNVETHLGRFRGRGHFCPLCKGRFFQPEEKESDVRLATRCLQGAFKDEFDAAVVISADSDQLPLFETMRVCFPDKAIGVIFPFERQSRRLAEIASFRETMVENHLLRSMLPETVELTNGRKVTRPGKWSWPQVGARETSQRRRKSSGRRWKGKPQRGSQEGMRPPRGP